MRVAFLTLGCKVNTYETEVMAQAFRAAGDQVVSFEEEADVYVVNTCTVTATGDKKSRQALRAAKRRNPAALVAAVGCYAQVAEQTLRAMPEVDVVLGNLHKPELPQLVRRHLQGAPLPPLPEILKQRTFEPMEAVHSDRTRAALKVQDGCCNFCSYCIIPYARGPVRSKPEEDAAREFAALLREGYREIVLTGIEIASYGEGAGEEGSLLSLLTRLVALLPEGGDARIRLGSLEPRVVTEEFAAFLGQHPAICPQFHLSLQSGSDTVLRRMNRKYDTARYRQSVALLRQHLPDVMLTTDIIVGFPGETEEEFLETVAFAREMRFLKVHVFPYSRREGTPAAARPDQTPGPVKTDRAARLAEVCDGIRDEILAAQAGRVYPVLAETHRDGLLSGHTPNYLPVRFPGDAALCGEVVSVRITEADGDHLLGEAAPTTV